MSEPPREATARACLRCERRAWLLGALSGPLDLKSRDRWRMLEALALEDGELIDALGGARKASLRAEHREFAPRRVARGVSVERVCRDDDRYRRGSARRARPRC